MSGESAGTKEKKLGARYLHSSSHRQNEMNTINHNNVKNKPVDCNVILKKNAGG